MREVLDHWNPDDSNVPEDYKRYDTLRHLDYQNPEEYEEALMLRNAELPFVIHNIPTLNNIVEKWDDAYLGSKFGPGKLAGEQSKNNHFMYYSPRLRGTPQAPTDAIKMEYSRFAEHARRTDIDPEEKHYYMRASYFEGNPKYQFIGDDYAGMFSSERGFFMVDPTKFAGIHCRFGEMGVIAESHYDQGRNFITMAMGTKRYILNPPHACPNLHIMLSGGSARHSAVDWSAPDLPNTLWDDEINVASEGFYQADSIDVFLQAGDVLYVPAFWFHYPINLDHNAQCNARSGTPESGALEVKECGLTPSATEHGEEHETAREQVKALVSSGTFPPVPADGFAEEPEEPVPDLPREWVPIGVDYMGQYASDPNVRLCPLDREAYIAEPDVLPMSRDLFARSKCDEPQNMKHMRVSELKRIVDAEADAAGSAKTVTGFVFHESRVGSTLVANMFASYGKVATYSEHPVPFSVMSARAPERQRAHDLHIIAAVLARPTGAKYLVFKMQSATVLDMDFFLTAFPNTPWVFLYRDTREIVASNLERALERGRVPDTVQALGGNLPPCMRSARNPPPAVKAVLGPELQDRQSPMRMAPERYCVAHLSGLAVTARDAALNRLRDGRCCSGSDGPRGALINYDALPNAVVDFIVPHFGIDDFPDSARTRMLEVATLYSKARGNVREFEGDVEDKQRLANTPATRAAMDSFGQRIYDSLYRLDAIHNPGALAEELSSGASEPDPVEDVTYPETNPLGDIITHWNPDDTIGPADREKYDTLRRLDFANAEAMAEARALRDAELPFVVKNVPALLAISEKWTDEYLIDNFGSSGHAVEVSEDNHFMWFNKNYKKDHPEYVPPVEERSMSYEEFLEVARRDVTPSDPHYYFKASTFPQQAKDKWIAEDYTLFDPERAESDFFLVDKQQQHGVHCRFGMKGVVAEAHYDSGRNFVTMARGHKRYLLAPPSECEALQILKSGPSLRHSAVDWSDPEHSTHGWGKEGEAKEAFYKARAIDTVIGPGEALYIPSFYFHYPISLDESIQCNSRSGVPPTGGAAIEECGFRLQYTEGPTATSNTATYADDDGGFITQVTNWFTGGKTGRRGKPVVSPFSDPVWIAVAGMGGVVFLAMAYKVGRMFRNARTRRKPQTGLG